MYLYLKGLWWGSGVANGRESYRSGGSDNRLWKGEAYICAVAGGITVTYYMKLVTNKFKSGGLREKRAVTTWNVGNHVNICL